MDALYVLFTPNCSLGSKCAIALEKKNHGNEMRIYTSIKKGSPVYI